MLRLDEPVLTPHGWYAHGDFRPGDFVFGLNGLPTRVVALSPISTAGAAYEIEFDDHATIQASADHLWAVECKTRKRIPGTWRADRGPQRMYRETATITTRDIAAYQNRPDNRLAIPINAPLDLPDVALSIDPYVLGVWLPTGIAIHAGLSHLSRWS